MRDRDCRRFLGGTPVIVALALSCAQSAGPAAPTSGKLDEPVQPAKVQPAKVQPVKDEPLDLSRRAARPGSDARGGDRAEGGSSRQRPERYVELSLRASAPFVEAGQHLWLAAHFQIHEDAHIYWSNPGEAGLETRAIFSAPDGFRVGEAQYPGPERFETEPGVVSFGYAQQAAILVEVQAPQALDSAGRYPFQVEASWLSCSDICIKESATAELVLAAAAPQRTSNQAAPNALETFISQLPSAFSQLPGASHEWEVTDTALRLRLSATGVEVLDFFPFRRAPFGQKLPQHRRDRRGFLVEFRPDALRSEATLEGVVRAKRAGQTVFFELELPVPKPTEPTH